MTSSKNTVWIAGTGVLAVLILVATYFLLVAPKRAEAGEIAAQTATVALSNAQLEQETQLLASQFATLDERKAELAAIVDTLPAEADVPDLLRDLETYAGSSGVTLTSVTPGVPVAHDGATTPDAPLVDISLSVTVEGSFAATELYVKQLQADMGRFLLLESAAVSSGTTSSTSDVTTTLAGRIFVVRDLNSAASSATAATATTPTTTTPDATSSSTESVSVS